MAGEIRFTIKELRDSVAAALADAPAPANGQVRAVPDTRTIRYYTTIGLLDAPAEMRGRTALYGRRHLAQLVAVKRLQAQGASLAEAQQRLAGQPMDALMALAQLADEAEAERPAPPVASRREAFWAAVPAAVSAQAVSAQTAEREAVPQPRQRAAGGHQSTALTLEGGAVIVLPPGVGPLTEEQIETINRAAQPLADVIAALARG